MPKKHDNKSRKELLLKLIDQVEASIEELDTNPTKPDDADAIYSEFTSLLIKLEDELYRLTEGPEFV